MPVPMLKSFAKKAGKSEAEAEFIWNDTKKDAKKKFKKEDGHFWAYVNAVVQRKLGLKEEKITFRTYYGSSYKGNLSL
jgi:hypothetical protein